jgi:hypothetical protein
LEPGLHVRGGSRPEEQRLGSGSTRAREASIVRFCAGTIASHAQPGCHLQKRRAKRRARQAFENEARGFDQRGPVGPPDDQWPVWPPRGGYQLLERRPEVRRGGKRQLPSRRQVKTADATGSRAARRQRTAELLLEGSHAAVESIEIHPLGGQRFDDQALGAVEEPRRRRGRDEAGVRRHFGDDREREIPARLVNAGREHPDHRRRTAGSGRTRETPAGPSGRHSHRAPSAVRLAAGIWQPNVPRVHERLPRRMAPQEIAVARQLAIEPSPYGGSRFATEMPPAPVANGFRMRAGSTVTRTR